MKTKEIKDDEILLCQTRLFASAITSEPTHVVSFLLKYIERYYPGNTKTSIYSLTFTGNVKEAICLLKNPAIAC